MTTLAVFGTGRDPEVAQGTKILGAIGVPIDTVVFGATYSGIMRAVGNEVIELVNEGHIINVIGFCPRDPIEKGEASLHPVMEMPYAQTMYAEGGKNTWGDETPRMMAYLENVDGRLFGAVYGGGTITKKEVTGFLSQTSGENLFVFGNTRMSLYIRGILSGVNTTSEFQDDKFAELVWDNRFRITLS
jgi:hypothetical protein